MLSSFKKTLFYNKYLIVIIFSAAFLRLFRLNELMPFIGDQAWFYLSARDFILSGKFPLVGITTSHTWLSQGPIWTYILVPLLYFFKFNPLAPAYFTSLVDVLTVFIAYKVFSTLFSKRIGIITSLLYAFSPIVIIHSRIPYHTNLIPLFVILFIYFLSKWFKGSLYAFPLLILILSILYNLELATAPLLFVFVAFFIYGLYKKNKWVTGLLNRKTIFLSFFFLILVMSPVFIYDFQHGFLQTVKFAFWFPRRFLEIFSYDFPQQSSGIWYFFLNFINKILFLPSAAFALLIFFLSFTVLFLRSLKDKNNNYKILFLIVLVPFLAFLINNESSEAYLPILFPQLILMVALFFDELIKIKKTWLVSVLLLIIIALNSYSLLSRNYLMNQGYGLTFAARMNASKAIIKKTKGNEYNLIGKGEGSKFESFTMNYEYLAWYLGKPPSHGKKKIKIIVEEKNALINISRIVNK